MIANHRFDTITVREVGGTWLIRDANDVTLYEYTTETAANHKAEQVREWGLEVGTVTRQSRVLAQMNDERVRLMSLVVRTYRHLTDNLARELEQAVGIPPVFFDVLIHVAAASGGRLTMSRLSREVALTTGGMTRLVDRMVEAGLVVREHSSRDRRSIHVALTAAGQEMLKRSIAAHIESIDRHLIAPLNDCDRASLTVTVTKVLGLSLSGGAPGEPGAKRTNHETASSITTVVSGHWPQSAIN